MWWPWYVTWSVEGREGPRVTDVARGDRTLGEPMARTPTTRRRRPLGRAALALLAGLFVLAAVGWGDDDGEDETGTDPTADETSTTTSSTTAELTPEEEAKAAYLEFVDVVDRLLRTGPDPDSPDLARLAIDPVLGRLQDSLATLRAENHIWQTGPRSSHLVMSVAADDDGTVLLRDCYVGNDTRIDQDDGSVVSSGLTTEVLEVRLDHVNGDWFVRDITTAQSFDGEVQCPQ